ncbi:MAG: hypothetical protein M1816_004890 [Peltula sp. TS41687]|nr:MAG: hypothetical protein M1816_004890 [Peltula sp. TS41687]
MPTDDLAQYATSELDFYEILGATFENSETDIRRAYRKTALKYHPDKNAGNPAAVEKFHLVQIAYDVLSDPSVKAAYDNARAARLARQRQKNLLDGRRRQMVDELERREKGVKRGLDEEFDAEEKLRREISRLAEDGKRRRREREEMLRQERLQQEAEEVKVNERTASPASKPDDDSSILLPKERGNVSEVDRTVKIRWKREGPGESIDKDTISTLFSKFGDIEATFLLKDKKQRAGPKKEKKLMATGVVQFASIVGAHAAVEDFPKQTGSDWKVFESVFWASNKEPDFGFLTQSPPAETPSSSPPPQTKSSRHAPFPGMESDGSASKPDSAHNTDDQKNVPTFASFSKSNTPSSSTNGSSLSLEEMTLIRMKNAQKKLLEEELRRKEQEEELQEK